MVVTTIKMTPEQGGKLTMTWELDLWGNLRWAKDKSIAQFLGSIEAQRALKMSIVSEVAQAYFELVALDNELNIVRQTLYARKEGVRLAKLRFEGGLTSETSYQQAQVEYARTATLVPELERKISLKENDIAFLAGEYPHRIQRSILPEEVKLPETLPVGLPSTLLERRPDVREAEQKLIAANASVGIAYTNIFPRLSLTAQYGVESEEFSDFFKSPILWQFLLNHPFSLYQWPINKIKDISLVCNWNVSQQWEIQRHAQTGKRHTDIRATVMNYIKYLADARLINMVYPKGEEFPKKPSKIMMHNSNLMYSIYLSGKYVSSKVEEQDVLDTFFANSLWKDHKVHKGDKEHLVYGR